MPTKDPEKRRKHMKTYYEKNKEKWLGEDGYKKHKKQYTPSKLCPVVFEMVHPSGQTYIGVTRSLRNYLGSAHIKKTVKFPIKEWSITVLESYDDVTLRELREKGRVYAIEKGCPFLGETKHGQEKPETDVEEQITDDPPLLASTASSMDLKEFVAEARRRMDEAETE